MKTPKRQKRKGVTAEEHEEHVISILVNSSSIFNEIKLSYLDVAYKVSNIFNCHIDLN